MSNLQRNRLALDTRRAGEDIIAIRRDGATPYQTLNDSAVSLSRYQPAFYDALSGYSLPDEQLRFSASFDFCINERKDLDDPDKIVVVILVDEQPVGFFVLDFGADKCSLTDNKHAVLVRSLSINPCCQGMGVGTRAMRLLPKFVYQQRPDTTEIVLSVNVANKGAYKTYRNAGYCDTGDTIMGPAGQQYIMSLALDG